MVVVFEHGRAELVVVGVVPLRNTSTRAASINCSGLGLLLEVAQQSCAAAVSRSSLSVGEDLVDRPLLASAGDRRAAPARRARSGFRLAAAVHRLAEQRQERGVLQQQHPPRVVVGRSSGRRSAGRWSSSRRAARRCPLPHEQFAGADEQGVPDRLRRDAAIEQLDHLVAGVVGASRCAASPAGRVVADVVGLAVEPVGRESSRPVLRSAATAGRRRRRAWPGCSPSCISRA